MSQNLAEDAVAVESLSVRAPTPSPTARAAAPDCRSRTGNEAPMSLAARLIRNRWMFVPIGLLTLSVSVGVTTVALAVAGHPIGAEPDYYAKAASWDAHRLQQAINDKLRWNVAPTIVAGTQGSPLLQIEVRDKYGGIIEADAAEVEAIPVAMADARETLSMGRVAPGRFERELSARVPGQWEFRLTVKKGETVYTDTFRRTLHFSKSGKGNS
jgi:hypothetical protein